MSLNNIEIQGLGAADRHFRSGMGGYADAPNLYSRCGGAAQR